MTPASRPIRIAAHLQLQHADYDAIRRAAQEAENIGVDIVFTITTSSHSTVTRTARFLNAGPCRVPGRNPRAASRSVPS